MNVKTIILPGAIILAGITVAGAIIHTSGSGGSVPTGANQPGAGRTVAVAVADDDPSIGDPAAPVTLIAFEDFECPFCQRFNRQTLPAIIEQYVKSGRVRLVWKDFPLSIHSRAQLAHEAARCAWEQEKFWEYHDRLFGNPDDLNKDDLQRHANALGLNQEQFSACLAAGKYTALIRQKVREGVAAGVSGTPSFLINGRTVVGAQPYQTFADIIAQEVK